MLNLLLSSAVILLVTMLIYLFMLHAYIFLLSLIEVTLHAIILRLKSLSAYTIELTSLFKKSYAARHNIGVFRWQFKAMVLNFG